MTIREIGRSRRSRGYPCVETADKHRKRIGWFWNRAPERITRSSSSKLKASLWPARSKASLSTRTKQTSSRSSRLKKRKTMAWGTTPKNWINRSTKSALSLIIYEELTRSLRKETIAWSACCSSRKPARSTWFNNYRPRATWKTWDNWLWSGTS